MAGFDTPTFLRAVEDEWQYQTKGELCLTPEWDGDGDVDRPVALLAASMAAGARDFIDTTATGQSDRYGNEYVDGTYIPDEEIARRVVSAIHVLLYGVAL